MKLKRKAVVILSALILAISCIQALAENTLSGRIEILYMAEKPPKQEVSEIIFYGDSRVVGMGMACSGNVYIGEVAMGYEWMAGAGLPLLLEAMSSHPNADVVICFGVNDVGNIGSYMNWFQDFCRQYPDRRIWFESVNPIEDGMASANGYFANNSMVIDFNRQLEASLAGHYLDTYSELVADGYGTPDGVHYDAGTYQMIEEKTKELINTF